jgi:hypothetical protein
MKPKDRIILLQKQLAVAVKALKDISNDGISVSTADFALEEIERIKIVQEGIRS